jgi:hypothetical protein
MLSNRTSSAKSGHEGEDPLIGSVLGRPTAPHCGITLPRVASQSWNAIRVDCRCLVDTGMSFHLLNTVDSDARTGAHEVENHGLGSSTDHVASHSARLTKANRNLG